MAGPSGGFTKHEKLSMDSLMLFSAIAALLGILALTETTELILMDRVKLHRIEQTTLEP